MSDAKSSEGKTSAETNSAEMDESERAQLKMLFTVLRPRVPPSKQSQIDAILSRWDAATPNEIAALFQALSKDDGMCCVCTIRMSPPPSLISVSRADVRFVWCTEDETASAPAAQSDSATNK